MSALLDLAARVEAATGADRELDAEIALACGIVRERDGSCFYGHADYSVMVLERDYYDHGGHAPELPHYTASLDAAMALVPEGCDCLVDVQYGVRAGKPHAYAFCRVTDGRGWECGDKAYAITPALALCASALRARAASPDSTSRPSNNEPDGAGRRAAGVGEQAS